MPVVGRRTIVVGGIGAASAFLAVAAARTYLRASTANREVLTDGRKAMTVYDFQAKTIDGEDVALSAYRGKVLLIVNVASRCGFTPQYEGLEQLFEKYKDKGLTILGFPCNQFGSQEPGTETEIKTFCESKYGVTFPLFSKIDVNGAHAHPLYNFLKHARPGILGTEAIKWNFTKFLIDREGRVVQRYAPQDKPEALENDVKAAL
jgi:glutathione peroxidase